MINPKMFQENDNVKIGGRFYGVIRCRCRQCKKAFLRTPEHVYKRSGRHGIDYFCGWNCMRAFDREKEEIRKNTPIVAHGGRKKAAG